MNILFLMDDQHNPDYVSYAKNPKAKTPNIDWIGQGCRFNAAVTTNPVCTPSRCAIFTGKYPHQVNMMTMSGDLNPKYPTMFQAAQKAGYYTAGIGKFHLWQGWHWDIPVGMGHDLAGLHHLSKQYGFDYVWEAAGKGLSEKNYCDYCKHLDERGLLEGYRNEIARRAQVGHPEYPDTSESFGISYDNHVEVVIADRIIEQIVTRDKSKPFFIFGSFLSPHPIIDPPQKYYDEAYEDESEGFLEKFNGREMTDEIKARWVKNRRGYRALVHLVDDQIGRIISALRKENLLNDTMIVFTSDHGDLLGNFGIDGKNRPERESSNVPLVIRHPKATHGLVINPPVSTIDVTATILEAIGLEPKKALSMFWPAWNSVIPSRSLMPILMGECDKVREYTFTENDGFEMIQTTNFKYIRRRTIAENYIPPTEEFYDLVNDPLELENKIANTKYIENIEWCRARRDFVLNSTPTGQIRFAPLISEKN